jgi:hypothetical protein
MRLPPQQAFLILSFLLFRGDIFRPQDYVLREIIVLHLLLADDKCECNVEKNSFVPV